MPELDTTGLWDVQVRAITNLEKSLSDNLDIFWLRDETLEESDNLPDPEILAQEIVDDLQTALEQFASIASEVNGSSATICFPKATDV
ncbi:MAG: hypothetical protein R3C19_25320 [Planctomycetaceae bacterium]